MRRIPPSLQIYGALLGSLAEGERWADVLAYLDRMVADGVAPDAVATNTAVLAAAELGDGRRAISLLEGEGGSRGGRGGGEVQQRRRQRLREGQGRGEGEEEEARRHGCGDGGGRGELSRSQRSRRAGVVRGEGEEGEGARRAGDGQAAGVGMREDEAFLEESPRPTEEERQQDMAGAAGVAVGSVVGGHASSPGEAGTEGGGGAAAAAAAAAADGDDDSSGVGGGWETATPGLLNSVLHALDEAGEDAAILETVKRGRDKGVLLNMSIYRWGRSEGDRTGLVSSCRQRRRLRMERKILLYQFLVECISCLSRGVARGGWWLLTYQPFEAGFPHPPTLPCPSYFQANRPGRRSSSPCLPSYTRSFGCCPATRE